MKYWSVWGLVMCTAVVAAAAMLPPSKAVARSEVTEPSATDGLDGETERAARLRFQVEEQRCLVRIEEAKREATRACEAAAQREAEVNADLMPDGAPGGAPGETNGEEGSLSGFGGDMTADGELLKESRPDPWQQYKNKRFGGSATDIQSTQNEAQLTEFQQRNKPPARMERLNCMHSDECAQQELDLQHKVLTILYTPRALAMLSKTEVAQCQNSSRHAACKLALRQYWINSYVLESG